MGAGAALALLALRVVALEPSGPRTAGGSSPTESGEPDQFVEVASSAGIHFTLTSGAAEKRYIIESIGGGGVAWIDYDNDGFQDLFLVNGSTFEHWKKGDSPPSRLYHNNRDGTFTDATALSRLDQKRGWGMGVCVGDYENDGYDDLYVTYYGGNVLYKNNGNGSFTDVTQKAGAGGRGFGMSCAFGDYDNDGRLDLYVTNYVDVDIERLGKPGSAANCVYHGIPVFCGPRGLTGDRDILFHNKGDGTFEDVTERAGIDSGRYYGLGVVMADFDRDRLLDIYVANDSTPSSLYRNNGDGTFTDIGAAAGVAYSEEGREQAGMGTDAGDYDNDGWPDLVKGNFSDDARNLYRNNRDGMFTDVAFSAGVGVVGWLYSTFGAKFLDYDNDGWKDIVLANGHVYPEVDRYPSGVTYAERNLLLRNLGNGRFDDVTLRSGPGLGLTKVSRGLATSDYDNDGDIEMLVTNLNATPDLIRRSRKCPNHSILVRTVGSRSNRNGIGAEVKLVAGGFTQYDVVRSGGSYLSSSDLRLHFGLGKTSTADRLEVLWPSGVSDVISSPPVDHLLVVKEGQGLIERKQLGAAAAVSSPRKSIRQPAKKP